MSPAPRRTHNTPPDELRPNRIPSDEATEPPAMIINASDGESDNELGQEADQLENGGYQLLSSDPNHVTEIETDQEQSTGGSDDTVVSGSKEELPVHTLSVDPQSTVVQPRWDSVELDEEKVQDIKARMATFVLPSCHHPSWASKITEDDWKEHLLEKIKSRSQDEPQHKRTE